MYLETRTCPEYLSGVKHFMSAALADMKDRGKTAMYCPCRDCRNEKKFPKPDNIHAHLVMRGFKENYTCWNKHGEEGLNEGEMDRALHADSVDQGLTPGEMDHDLRDEDILGFNDNDLEDFVENVDQMVQDVERHDEYNNGEFAKFQEFVRDSKTPLYPNCKEKYTRIFGNLKLLQLKATHGWTDKSFEALLDLLRDMLPEGNLVPEGIYDAKKIICPLGLEIEKIHACKQDCILFRGEYAELDQCPVCGTHRYKRRNDGGDGDEGKKSKGGPRKVVWYFPVIPRLKRLFANKNEAQLVRWHKEGRKNDAMIRHLTDSAQWRIVDSTFGWFAEELRNIRFAMSTDGMNPFGNMSTSHSTWPVVLSIYNLPPWLCNKRKYIMLSILISGPKQPGNDIDVYLRPLVDDLKKLWSEGVEVWDQYKQEYFTLHAMLFVTINDLPALRNLSGQSKRKGEACPHCLDDTCSLRLNNSKKIVYMRHRRFLPRKHPYRNMDKQFDGTREKALPPRHFSGEDVHNQVKNINVVLGKRNQSSKDDEQLGMWNKKSILFKLEY
jgi:hypothetical protein